MHALQRSGTETRHIAARDVAPVILTEDSARTLAQNAQTLRDYGIDIRPEHIPALAAHGMDADLVALNPTNATVQSPIQFLQNFLTGVVHNVTDARKIDKLVGKTTDGAWEDEEIVQQVLERTGEAVLYGDYTNTALANWNTNFERRTVVRFEQGVKDGALESARAARIQINSMESKRSAASEALSIERNRVGFNGYNNGANRTYGFLNDPMLPAYTTLPAGAGGTTGWSGKTFQEITQDIITGLAQLRTQSGELIDPTETSITMAIATAARDFMSRVTDLGNRSVTQWLKETYPNVRVESAPELDGANGGSNVLYFYAETVGGTGTDDNRTFIQVVPADFRTVGVAQLSKGTEEVYSNATAGIMLKRPYAVARYSGV